MFHSFKVAFLLGNPSCEVIFMCCHIPVRLSSWNLVFPLGCLPVSLSSISQQTYKGLVCTISLNLKLRYFPGWGWVGETKNTANLSLGWAWQLQSSLFDEYLSKNLKVWRKLKGNIMLWSIMQSKTPRFVWKSPLVCDYVWLSTSF